MLKKVSIKTINNKNKTSKTLLNVFVLTFIMFVVLIGNVYALSYTVSYNNNTGSGTMSDSTYTSNPGTLSTNTFTKSGYKFMGWNKNSGATSDWYRENNSINAEDGDAITLYAQWCKNSQGTIKISNNEVKDTYGNYVFRNSKYITVAPNDKTMQYGTTPTFNYTVNGTLNDEAGVTGTPTYTVKDSNNNTVSNIATASPGTYTIYVSGLSAASGYTLQSTNTGTLTIVKAALTVVHTNYSGTYDGSPHYGTLKVTSPNWNGATIVSGTTTSYGTTVTNSGVVNTTYNLLPGVTNTTSEQVVYYKVTGGTNYEDATGQVTLSLSRKNATLTLSPTSKTIYMGKINPDTISYTYDGDGTVGCTSSNTEYLTCSVNASAHTITLTPVAPTASAVTLTVGATEGTNYNSTSATASITIIRINADNLSYNPPSGLSSYDDVQKMMDYIAGLLNQS